LSDPGQLTCGPRFRCCRPRRLPSVLNVRYTAHKRTPPFVYGLVLRRIILYLRDVPVWHIYVFVHPRYVSSQPFSCRRRIIVGHVAVGKCCMEILNVLFGPEPILWTRHVPMRHAPATGRKSQVDRFHGRGRVLQIPPMKTLPESRCLS